MIGNASYKLMKQSSWNVNSEEQERLCHQMYLASYFLELGLGEQVESFLSEYCNTVKEPVLIAEQYNAPLMPKFKILEVKCHA